MCASFFLNTHKGLEPTLTLCPADPKSLEPFDQSTILSKGKLHGERMSLSRHSPITKSEICSKSASFAPPKPPTWLEQSRHRPVTRNQSLNCKNVSFILGKTHRRFKSTTSLPNEPIPPVPAITESGTNAVWPSLHKHWPH